MPYDLIIRDATLVQSTGREVADVAIQDGKIAYVGPRPPLPGREEISGIGKFLMPGVIDTAVQFDPTDDPSVWEIESSAAVTGGITTVISLPGGRNPVTSLNAARQRAKRVEGRSWCNYALWAAAQTDNVAEITEATRHGYTVGALATVHSSENANSLNVDGLHDYRDYPGVLGIQLGCEEQADNTNAPIPFELANLLRGMAAEGTKLHIVHLSTAAELQIIDPIRGDVSVTAGVTPHHLFLSSDEEIPFRTQPPVRCEHDRRTLWSAIKKGRLDCIASDHHPTQHVRETGVPGTELLFPLMLCAVQHGRLSIESLVALCSEKPADIFGLTTKGRITPGADADLILFCEGELSPVSGNALISKAGWTPYERKEVAPKPELVIVNGQIVAQDGALIGTQPTGHLVRRDIGVAA